jgi:putative transposase
LKLVFLVVSGVMSVLGLSRRSHGWKDAETLMLRHQLAVAERERPKARARLTWPDRAWLRCSPGRCLPGAWPGCGCSSLRALSCAGIATSSAAGGGRLSPVWPVRTAVHAPQGAVGSAAARPKNESWGYRRIHGEPAGLGITVAPSTVWRILKDAGVDPAPRRDGPGWAEFLRSRAQGILAMGFFTAGLLNGAKVTSLS